MTWEGGLCGSMENVLHAVVAKLEEQLEQEGYTVNTFLNIEGGFGNSPLDIFCLVASR